VNSFSFPTDRVTTLSLKDSEVGLQLFPKLETFHYFTSKPKPLAFKEFLYLHRKTLKFLSLTNETLVVSVSYLENLKHLTVLGQLSKEIVKTSQSLRSLILPSQKGYCLTSSLAEALQENVFLTRISLDSGIDYFSVTLKRNKKIAQIATLIKAVASFKLKQHKDILDCIARDVSIIRKK
jgi:ribonucleotide monophosphatase NagD (HAD superfamily)